MIDDTHDASLTSWIDSANDQDSDFPIQNLPLGVFCLDGSNRIGVAIGDQILDLKRAADAGLLTGVPISLVNGSALNRLMAAGRTTSATLRARLSSLLRSGSDEREKAEQVLVPMSSVEMALPAVIGDYTDFYASIHHATNVGSMFRPDQPLLPNYKWLPVGYHGRASSIVISGTDVRRPLGQTREGESNPTFGPSRRLDYEMEVGFFIAGGNDLGTPVPIGRAEEQLFGFCLVNDWSARDIQTWEYQPLGPFLAKNFATSISPWVVTADALAPFRVPAFRRDPSDPAPLPHLTSAEQQERGGLDITLEVSLSSKRMREEGLSPMLLSSGQFADMYWTPGQMVAHHTSSGCNLRPGDLLASGTVSGAGKDARGSLLERAWRGTEPVELPTGELRRFLEDGDELVMRGFCERDGFRRIGFGECRGVILPAHTD